MTWTTETEPLEIEDAATVGLTVGASDRAGLSRRDGFCEDAFSSMWNHYQKFPLLTAERETQLAMRLANGDQSAGDEMVECNMRLVVSIAQRCYRFAGPSLALADLVQDGTVGLIRAVGKFDHRRGFRFSTYASFWIRQAVMRSINDRGPMIRLPCHATEKLHHAERARFALTQTLERPPSLRELAGFLEEDETRLESLLNSSAAPASLDDVDDDGHGNGREALPAWSDDERSPLERALHNLNQRELHGTVRMAMESLSAREAKILSLRFGLFDGECHTLGQVAAQLNVSLHRARNMERAALRSLGTFEPLREFVAA